MGYSNVMVAALSTSCALAFLWGYKRHFIQSTKSQPMRLVCAFSVIGYVALVVDVIVKKPGELWPLSVPLFVFSIVLFAYSAQASRGYGLGLAFSNTTPHNLIRYGPYRYVRHPFYLSYIIAWIAVPCIYDDMWPVAQIATFVYVFASFNEEARILRSPLADEYRLYMGYSGMLLPKLVTRKSLPIPGLPPNMWWKV